MFDIQEELKKLPAKPGVYIMHDDRDAIIYVGKAISLKNRVRQYFQTSRNKGAKIEQMVTRIARFEYIVTDSELEALVLECNLIKEHRPKYNTMLKDDKTYPFIKVTTSEAYPRILFFGCSLIQFWSECPELIQGGSPCSAPPRSHNRLPSAG